jgi:ABC-type nitrate/sulfonate/bicarbonate transport system substrate-binding protein
MHDHKESPRSASAPARRLPRRLSRRAFLHLGVAGAATLALAGCAGGGTTSGQGGGRLRMVYQTGTTHFAQLVIMEHEGWLAEDLPDYEVSWMQLESGAAVRTALVTGQAEVGAGGIGPFLVGYSNGIDWKILNALADIEISLMVNDDRFQSLEDFGSEDQIAVVAPDSVQAVFVRKAAEQQLGDPGALDNNLVTLPNPDSVQALLSGQVAAHATYPPFTFPEQDRGARSIVRSFDLFGTHNLTSVWVLQEYHDANPEIMEPIYNNVQRATTLIGDDPDRAGEILAQASQLDPVEETRYLTAQGVAFTTEPHGYITFAEFMQSAGLIQTVPGSWQDLVYDNLKDANGS